MPEVIYGNRKIEYSFLLKEKLKSYYVTVDRKHGVVLKGKEIPNDKADKFVLKKAKWILKKLEIVKHIKEEDIVTGSRIPYLGKKYYTTVIAEKGLEKGRVEFNYSKFKIYINPEWKKPQDEIRKALDIFYKLRAKEKITPRIEQWSLKTGLHYKELKFRKLEKRWGSCTSENNIIINYLSIQLSYELIDYLVVHELCHTRVKNHSKEFYGLVSEHLPGWKELDGKMEGMRL